MTNIRPIYAILLAALLFVAPSASADLLLTNVGGSANTVSYLGPADNLGSPTAFYGVEAMSTAYAAALGNGIVLCTPLDVACETEPFGSNGHLNLGTTGLTCTIPGGATICTIKEFFDQSGSGLHMIQTTPANRATFSPAAASNGCPVTTWECFIAAGSAVYSVSISSVFVPYSYAAVAERTGATTSFNTIIGNGPITVPYMGFNNSANNAALVIGAGSSILTKGANDNQAHSIQGIGSALGAGGMTLVVDNSTATGTVSDTTATGTTLTILNLTPGASDPFNGAGEYILYVAGTAFNSTQYGNQHTQDSGRFGTP